MIPSIEPVIAPPPPSGPAKALVLITRLTTCSCGEHYSAPEIYERYTPQGHWSVRNILHLKRRTGLPQFRLPVERLVVNEQVPFCPMCLALGDPLGSLPLPPDPKASVGGLGAASAPSVPTPTIALAAKAAPRTRSSATLSIDDIYGV